MKGENFAKTSIYRKHGLKNGIWYFSPFDEDRGSHRFNPLARIAEVPSNALSRSTITAVTESQSRVRALEGSANVSRRSEERPLISANEVLRFPLDEVLVLPEGQYPIRARHIRYYEDRHFGPIDRARKGKALPTIREGGGDGRQAPVGKISGLVASAERADAVVFGEAARVFNAIAEGAKRPRKVPSRL